MKTLRTRILSAVLFAFVAITLSSSLYAGNGTNASNTGAAKPGATPPVTSQDVINYLASQGIKAVAITPANDGTSNVVATTASGNHVLVYISGDQFLGHDDLPQ